LVADLATRQYGVVSRRELLEAGLGTRAIEHRIAAGRLHKLHRGVYAVGHRVLSREGRWMAAVLAGGESAVLSHRSAAALWEIRPTSSRPPEITAPGEVARRELHSHRARLGDDEATIHRGIPVTTPARTLLDLAGIVPRHQLERAAEQAEVLHLADLTSLDALFQRYPRRKGVRVLRAVVESGRPTKLTRSELEARFLVFLDRHELPTPRVNARVPAGGRRLEVDCVWPNERVAVELDGHAWHSSRAAFERDRARDRALQAAGWRVVRITWRQVRDEPEVVARDLRRLLGLSVRS
jgi:very-short-patch-repair endonuclease